MHHPPRPPRPPPLAALVCSGLLALNGCATRSVPPPPARPAAQLTLDEAIEQARRDERQRIMQEYWQEHTTAPERGPTGGFEPQPPLPYPGGLYGGIRFAPRQAPDPSLGEPER